MMVLLIAVFCVFAHIKLKYTENTAMQYKEKQKSEPGLSCSFSVKGTSLIQNRKEGKIVYGYCHAPRSRKPAPPSSALKSSCEPHLLLSYQKQRTLLLLFSCPVSLTLSLHVFQTVQFRPSLSKHSTATRTTRTI